MTIAALSELRSILGDRLLAELVGLPSASLAAVSLTTVSPDVAGRIKQIGQVVWCLLGTYYNEGVSVGSAGVGLS